MAIPVIAAGARKAGSSAKSSVSKVETHRQSRTGTQNTRSGAMRRESNTRNRIRQRGISQPRNEKQTRGGKVASMRKKVAASIHELSAKVRVARASLVIGRFVIPFCVVQFLFGIVQLGGAGAEYVGEQFLWGIGAILIPGQTVYAAGYIVSMIFGCATMFVAALVYALQGVTWWRGFGLIFFLLFMVLSIVPFFNMVPWVIFWMLVVVYTQK